MKKTALLFITLLLPIFLFAQEADVPKDAEGNVFTWDDGDEELVEVEKGSWIQSRGFEIGLLYLDEIYLANNIVSVNQILSKEIEVDLNKIPSVLSTKLGLGLTPIYFNYDSKNGWGFGLHTGVQTTGFFGINADLPIIKNAKNKKSDVGAAAFVNIMPNGFFTISDFKVSVKPTLFFPAAYTTSKIHYTLDGKNTHAEAVYDINAYIPFDENSNFVMPTAGFDLSASVEYPLSAILNLQEVHPILNFDVGAGITSVPLVPGTMNNYQKIKGNFTIAKNNSGFVEYDDTKDDDEIITESDSIMEARTGKQSIYRPFVMHFWADWRPLGTELLTVTPLLGFGINTMYAEPGSLEAGISGLLNLNNIFFTKIGINYLDRMWINSLDLALNLRAVELNLGLSLRSQNFVQSWTLSGLGVGLGMKFGW